MTMKVGIYYVPEEHLQIAADLGADYVQTYDLKYDWPPKEGWEGTSPWTPIEMLRNTLTYMDRCQDLGLQVMLEVPRNFLRGDESLSLAKIMEGYIAPLTNHPALYTWYIADEPEVDPSMWIRYKEIYDAIGYINRKRVTATAHYWKHLCKFPYPADRYLCSTYWIRRYWPPCGIGGKFIHLVWRFLSWKYRKSDVFKVIPVIQCHDADLWGSAVNPAHQDWVSRTFNPRGYRDPTTQEILDQIDRARDMGLPEIWLWGLHASESFYPYKLTDIDIQRKARIAISRAKGERH